MAIDDDDESLSAGEGIRNGAPVDTDHPRPGSNNARPCQRPALPHLALNGLPRGQLLLGNT